MSASIVFPLDPRTLSTAQQKKVNFRSRRIFSNPKVVAAMKAVRTVAQVYTSRVREVLDGFPPVRLSVVFYFAYPKSAPVKGRLPSEPMPTGADLDNRVKAFNDALTEAGWWDDDRQITTLLVAKRLTTGKPRIEVSVAKDDGDDLFFFNP